MKKPLPRKSFHISDENYKKVSVRAAEEQTEKWKVIDKALRFYFEKEGDRKGE